MAKQSSMQAGSGERDFTIVSQFLGYRNKEDITNLPPGYLVKGSQNVRSNTAGRIATSGSFVLDGQADNTVTTVDSWFDWERNTANTRNLRAGNGKHQFRYVASAGDKWNGNTFTAGQVYWIDLQTALTSTRLNYTDFWDYSTELISLCLWVDGSQNLYTWSGGVTTLASASGSSGVVSAILATPTAAGTGYVVGDILTITTGGTGATVRVTAIGGGGAVSSLTLVTPGSGYTTGAGKATSGGTGTLCTVEISSVATGYIQKTGTTTWAEEGFLKNGTRAVTINGTSYAYTSGDGTTYLFGITGNPSAEPVNSVVFQTVITIPNSSLTSYPSNFNNDLIGVFRNQVYIASKSIRNVYVSKVNSYTNFSFTSPVRVVGEGAILTIDSYPVALVPQEDAMYVAAGKSQWYGTKFEVSSDNSKEILTVQRLKTGPRQAPLSQKAVFKSKNDVVFISNEPTLDTLGRVNGIFLTPQQSNISDPIKNDFDSYDFTNAAGIYHRNFMYITVPAENRVLIFNIIQNYWEAPQVLGISGFSIIDGELYGHSYNTLETFKLFSGNTANGKSIECKAIFSYMNFGTRTQTKFFNEWYSEGYLDSNTPLTLGLKYEIDGCATETFYDLDGTNTRFVCRPRSDASLGKRAIGYGGLGTDTSVPSSTTPPKFRWIRTFPRQDFYEVQPSYSSVGLAQSWELLAFGALASMSPYGNNDIKE